MKKYQKHIFVCTSYDCSSHGSEELFETLREKVRERDAAGEIKVTKTGCLKECEYGPIMVVYPDGVWYSRVMWEDLDEIVDSHLIDGRIVSRLLHHKMD